MYLPFNPIKGQQFTLTLKDTLLNPQNLAINTTTYSWFSNFANFTWSTTSLSENNAGASIAWSPSLGKFAALFSNGTHRVFTSTDGVTWSPQTAAEANSWRAICWSPDLNLFCAVSSDGTHRVMTSSDGVTWNTQTAAEANGWRCVIWVHELSLFVAGSDSGTHRIMTSSDGTTWNTQTASIGGVFQSLAWSSTLSKLVAGNQGGAPMYSSDASAWTTSTIAGGASTAVAWNPDGAYFLMVGSTNSFKSTDGIHWTLTNTTTPYSLNIQTANSLVYSSTFKRFFIGPSSNTAAGLYGTIATSTDGYTWRMEALPEAATITTFAEAPSLSMIAAIGNLGVNQVTTEIYTAVLKSPTITIYKDGASGNPASNAFTAIGLNTRTLVLTTSEMNADTIIVYYKYINSSNIEVEDSVIIYTQANELSSAPSKNDSISAKITAIWQYLLNKRTVTASQEKLYKSDGTTVLATGTVSDDGTTFTKGSPS